MTIAMLALGSLAAGPTAASSQPSYDCGAQLNATERTICNDADLARLDRTMASKFYEIYGALPPQRATAFRAEQTEWRRNRDACGTAIGCIRANYVYRIGLFDTMSGTTPPTGAPGPMRSSSTRVLPDGTIEKRMANGMIVRHLPNGKTERYTADGEKLTTVTASYQVQPTTLPPLPPQLESWGTALEGSLLSILGNILTDDEYTAYQSTEAGKDDYVLIDWRLRSISILTQP